MSSTPYGVRLIVGVAATAVEETRKLPQTLMMSPMTFASQVAQLVMKVQQDIAELVIKGDATLESLFPPKDEQPEWATFDDDETDGDVSAPSDDGDDESTGRMTAGRFALYSNVEDEVAETAAAAAKTPEVPAHNGADVPEVVAKLGYDGLTLAQLRARLTSLSVPELSELLSYEEGARARAPFQTLLANRITRASAK